MIKLLKGNRNNLFYTIFLYFGFAIISAIFFLIFTNSYYLSVLQDNTENEYSDKLTTLSVQLETIVEEIHYTNAMFYSSDDMQKVLFSDTPYKQTDATVLSSAYEALRTFSSTKHFIHSILIVSEEDDMVISNSGSGRIDEFFHYIADYDDYDPAFWSQQTSQGQGYIMYPPTVLRNNIMNTATKVIPIIQFSAHYKLYTDPLIVNVDESIFNSLLNANKLYDNSILFEYNESFLISRSDQVKGIDFTNQELMDISLTSFDADKHIQQIDGKRYLIVTYKNPNNNHYICALTPYSDLWAESMNILTFPLVIFTIGVIILILLSFFFTNRIYTPIHRVATLMKKNLIEQPSSNKNDLDYLNISFQSMLSEIVQLKEDLTLAIPYVCERYLMSLFDDNEILRENEVKDFLAQYDFNFPYDDFIVIRSELHFKEAFYNTRTKAEFSAICQGSLLIANDSFSSIENRYIFSISINEVCVILNLPKNYDKTIISDSVVNYHEALDIDETLLVVHSGIGRFNHSLNGLKTSFKEAHLATQQITKTESSMIRNYLPDTDHLTSTYTMEEENQLINYLLQGNETQISTLFETIIETNKQNKISQYNLRELYLQLYNTAIRVTNRRQINMYDLIGDDFVDIGRDIHHKPIDQVHKYISQVFILTANSCKKYNASNDLNSLKEYLDTHYTEEIYLDSIAEHYGKTANYLSKYIKKTLGVSYQDYISTLRIEKAKELLSTTSESIINISNQVGFNSRYPFIRKFKILEGVTPSEYRKLHK